MRVRAHVCVRACECAAARLVELAPRVGHGVDEPDAERIVCADGAPERALCLAQPVCRDGHVAGAGDGGDAGEQL
eukprot:6202795-Pleurochrysis_carterae.AAC.7